MKRSLTNEEILNTLNSWNIEINKTNFRDIAKLNLSDLDMAFSLLHELKEDYPRFIEDNTIDFIAILWERLAGDILNLSTASDLIEKNRDEVNQEIKLKELFNIWDLLKRKYEEGNIKHKKIANYLITEYPFDNFFITLLDELEIKMEEDSKRFLKFSQFIDEWKQHFLRYKNCSEFKDIIGYFLTTELRFYWYFNKFEIANNKFIEARKNLPESPWIYIEWFECKFNHPVDNIDHEELELFLLEAKNIMIKQSVSISEQLENLVRLEELYRVWGQSDKLDSVRNEMKEYENKLENENDLEDEDFEKGKANFLKNIKDDTVMGGLYTILKESNWDANEAYSGMYKGKWDYIYLSFICYECKIIYKEKILTMFVTPRFIESLDLNLSLKPDNGKIIIPYGILCPNCSSEYFMLDNSTKMIIISNFNEYHKTKKETSRSLSTNILKNQHKSDDKFGIFYFNEFVYSLNPKIKSHFQALNDIRRRLKKDPSNPDILLRYGNLLRKCNLHSNAKKYFLKLIKLNPKNIEGYFNLGEIYLYKGDTKRAKYCFQKMIKLKPKIWRKWKTQMIINELTLTFIDNEVIK